jgi:hypothetical protein
VHWGHSRELAVEPSTKLVELREWDLPHRLRVTDGGRRSVSICTVVALLVAGAQQVRHQPRMAKQRVRFLERPAGRSRELATPPHAVQPLAYWRVTPSRTC